MFIKREREEPSSDEDEISLSYGALSPDENPRILAASHGTHQATRMAHEDDEVMLSPRAQETKEQSLDRQVTAFFDGERGTEGQLETSSSGGKLRTPMARKSKQTAVDVNCGSHASPRKLRKNTKARTVAVLRNSDQHAATYADENESYVRGAPHDENVTKSNTMTMTIGTTTPACMKPWSSSEVHPPTSQQAGQRQLDFVDPSTSRMEVGVVPSVQPPQDATHKQPPLCFAKPSTSRMKATVGHCVQPLQDANSSHDASDLSGGAQQPIVAVPLTARMGASIGLQHEKPQDSTRTLERIATLQPNRIGKALDGRVCSKTTLRQRSRENANLTVFSFIIQDETGKINVTAWDDLAKQIYEMIKVGACYRFTMYKIKEANTANQAYRVTDHTHELTLSKWSKVIDLPEGVLPPLHTDLLSIVQLHGKMQNAIVDLVAVLFEIGPLHYINCQDGRTRPKRNVTLIDESCKSVTLGLWPDFTESLSNCEGIALLFQNLQVREYAGKVMLSTTTNTIIKTDADNETVHELNQWFTREGCDHAYEELEWSLSSTRTPTET